MVLMHAYAEDIDTLSDSVLHASILVIPGCACPSLAFRHYSGSDVFNQQNVGQQAQHANEPVHQSPCRRRRSTIIQHPAPGNTLNTHQ